MDRSEGKRDRQTNDGQCDRDTKKQWHTDIINNETDRQLSTEFENKQ